jgi:hypothetical protein
LGVGQTPRHLGDKSKSHSARRRAGPGNQNPTKGFPAGSAWIFALSWQLNARSSKLYAWHFIFLKARFLNLYARHFLCMPGIFYASLPELGLSSSCAEI